MTPEEQADIDAMARARDGDVTAFARLLTRHRPRVETFLKRLSGDRERAADGAQEVFLRVWIARHRYEGRARFTTFLYQIALNYWRDEQRKARSRPIEEAWDGGGSREEAAAATPPERGAGFRHLRAPATTEPHYQLFLRYRQWQIRQAIARLTEIHRIVFVLAYLEERRLAEIAAILELPLGTVKSRLHTAVRLLREWLTTENEENR